METFNDLHNEIRRVTRKRPFITYPQREEDSFLDFHVSPVQTMCVGDECDGGRVQVFPAVSEDERQCSGLRNVVRQRDGNDAQGSTWRESSGS